MAQKLAAGNWKMNGTSDDLDVIRDIAAGGVDCDVVICPPATLLHRARDLGVAIGGQDCHTATNGAHTGDISAPMLVDAGASHVILGHSERRADHGESDAMIADKITAAQAQGLHAILCIGESLAQRAAGETLHLITQQLTHSIPENCDPTRLTIAYEPIWAIGTGKIPTLDQIAQVHHHIRDFLIARFDGGANISVLYGGSVKPDNAAEIFAVPHVNGALVGGASLTAADFLAIAQALSAA